MTDSHDEWIDLNGKKSEIHDGPTDNEELQQQAQKDKAEIGHQNKGHAYGVIRRAGLAPWCSIRFMIQHAVGL